MPVTTISKQLKAPTSVDLCITKRCNHRCVHCYNPWRFETEPSLLREIEPKEVELIVGELEKNEVWSVTITGGEPLCVQPSLFSFCDSLFDKGFDLNLNTNLSLMTNEIAKHLVSRYDWQSTILTSLPGLTPDVCDSITQVRGSYQKIVKGIDCAKNAGIPVGVNVVVSRSNLSDLEDLKNFARDFDLDYVSVTRAIAPCYDLDNKIFYLSENEIKYLADCLIDIQDSLGIDVGSVTPFPACVLNDEKYIGLVSAKCAAGLSRCSIDAVSGDISACTHEDISYGNIYKDGLLSAWDAMSGWRRGLNLHSACKECASLPFCGGECRMISGHEQCKNYKLKNDIKFLTKSPMKRAATLEEGVYEYNPKTRMRVEEFGRTIRVGWNECYVGENVGKFVDCLRSVGSLPLAELQKMVPKEQDLLVVMSVLLELGVLVKTDSFD